MEIVNSDLFEIANDWPLVRELGSVRQSVMSFYRPRDKGYTDVIVIRACQVHQRKICEQVRSLIWEVVKGKAGSNKKGNGRFTLFRV